MEFFKITHRCIRCRKPLREDGTCQNPECVRYKPEPKEVLTQEMPSDGGTTKPSMSGNE